MTEPVRTLTRCPLELPLRGRTYRVPRATIDVGWRIVTHADGEDLARLVLDDTLDAMLADGAPRTFIERAVETAIVDIVFGREAAEETWNGGDVADTDAPAPEGLEALEEYGRGERDPATGLYEYYDELPRELAAESEGGAPVSWAAIADALDVVEYCFHADLGVDLEQVWHTASWRWFTVRIRGLLAGDTLLAAQFRPEEPTPHPDADPA